MPWERIFEIVWRSLAFIVAVAIILIVSGNWTRWSRRARWQRTNDAYLHTDLTPIAAKVGGYLRELPIQDFQRVHKGDVLAQIVDADYRVVVAEAEAKLAATSRRRRSFGPSTTCNRRMSSLRARSSQRPKRCLLRTSGSAPGRRGCSRRGRHDSIEVRERLGNLARTTHRAVGATAVTRTGCFAPVGRADTAARAERSDDQRRARLARCGETEPRVHNDPRAAGWRHRPTSGETRAAGRARHPDRGARAVAESLGDRELQGDADHLHGGRAAGGDLRRHVPRP